MLTERIAASRAGTTSLKNIVQSLNGKNTQESSLLSQANAIVEAAFARTEVLAVA